MFVNAILFRILLVPTNLSVASVKSLTSVKSLLSLVAMANPIWVNNKDWKPEDIFKLNNIELQKLKLHVAEKIGIRYKNVTGGIFNYVYAQSVGGTVSYTEDGAKAAIKEYAEAMAAKPTAQQGESESDFQKRLDTWSATLTRKSAWSCVINCCQLSWESPNGPWNEGYILSFWEKFKSGESMWDVTIDRKAGGILVSDNLDLTAINLIVMNASSTMALIMGVVFHVVHDGDVPTNLKDAFQSLKVTWLFSATRDEMINLSIKENIN